MVLSETHATFFFHSLLNWNFSFSNTEYSEAASNELPQEEVSNLLLMGFGSFGHFIKNFRVQIHTFETSSRDEGHRFMFVSCLFYNLGTYHFLVENMYTQKALKLWRGWGKKEDKFY